MFYPYPFSLQFFFDGASRLPFFGFLPWGLRDDKPSAQDHFDLQEIVIDELGRDQDVLHARTVEDWAAILSEPEKSEVVSVRRDGVLIAQAVVLFPQTVQEADMLDMELPDEPHRVATVCSVVTHPQYRCKDLMMELLHEADIAAWKRGRQHMLALINDTNFRSWTQFLKAGYYIVGCGFEPSDNINAYFAHRHLGQLSLTESFQRAADRAIIIPPQPLDAMKIIFKDGYVGFESQRDDQGKHTGGLILARA